MQLNLLIGPVSKNMKEQFTEKQVRETARQIYGKPICVDMLNDAMCEETLADAVEVIIIDSQFWDGIF